LKTRGTQVYFPLHDNGPWALQILMHRPNEDKNKKCFILKVNVRNAIFFITLAPFLTITTSSDNYFWLKCVSSIIIQAICTNFKKCANNSYNVGAP
jgi:hypothetical protein